MNELEQLIKEIQSMRANISKLAEKHKLTDPEIVGASKILDTILNEYEKLVMKLKND